MAEFVRERAHGFSAVKLIMMKGYVPRPAEENAPCRLS